MQRIFDSKEDFVDLFESSCQTLIGRTYEDCTDAERFQALASIVAAKSRAIGVKTNELAQQEQKKKVYYFSLEFLIGTAAGQLSY